MIIEGEERGRWACLLLIALNVITSDVGGGGGGLSDCHTSSPPPPTVLLPLLLLLPNQQARHSGSSVGMYARRMRIIHVWHPVVRSFGTYKQLLLTLSLVMYTFVSIFGIKSYAQLALVSRIGHTPALSELTWKFIAGPLLVGWQWQLFSHIDSAITSCAS